jgi:hypothetical protein
MEIEKAEEIKKSFNSITSFLSLSVFTFPLLSPSHTKLCNGTDWKNELQIALVLSFVCFAISLVPVPKRKFFLLLRTLLQRKLFIKTRKSAII